MTIAARAPALRPPRARREAPRSASAARPSEATPPMRLLRCSSLSAFSARAHYRGRRQSDLQSLAVWFGAPDVAKAGLGGTDLEASAPPVSCGTTSSTSNRIDRCTLANGMLPKWIQQIT